MYSITHSQKQTHLHTNYFSKSRYTHNKTHIKQCKKKRERKWPRIYLCLSSESPFSLLRRGCPAPTGQKRAFTYCTCNDAKPARTQLLSHLKLSPWTSSFRTEPDGGTRREKTSRGRRRFAERQKRETRMRSNNGFWQTQLLTAHARANAGAYIYKQGIHSLDSSITCGE